MLAGNPPRNCALLDPPQLYSGGTWQMNYSPTTSFRHSRGADGCGSTCTSRADGSVRAMAAEPTWMVDEARAIGSAGRLDVHYVPDAGDW